MDRHVLTPTRHHSKKGKVTTCSPHSHRLGVLGQQKIAAVSNVCHGLGVAALLAVCRVKSGEGKCALWGAICSARVVEECLGVVDRQRIHFLEPTREVRPRSFCQPLSYPLLGHGAGGGLDGLRGKWHRRTD
jgi:hypothetical protein